jgi:hypothetical protein
MSLPGSQVSVGSALHSSSLRCSATRVMVPVSSGLGRACISGDSTAGTSLPADPLSPRSHAHGHSQADLSPAERAVAQVEGWILG